MSITHHGVTRVSVNVYLGTCQTCIHFCGKGCPTGPLTYACVMCTRTTVVVRKEGNVCVVSLVGAHGVRPDVPSVGMEVKGVVETDWCTEVQKLSKRFVRGLREESPSRSPTRHCILGLSQLRTVRPPARPRTPQKPRGPGSQPELPGIPPTRPSVRPQEPPSRPRGPVTNHCALSPFCVNPRWS